MGGSMTPRPFELPPDDASPSQLLQLIREQRNSNEMLAQRMDIMAEQVGSMSSQLKEINEDTKGLKSAFGAARTTVGIVKWAAAFSAIVLGLIEGLRRMFT